MPRPGGDGDTRLTGTVSNAVYRGGATDYTLDVGGRELVVTLGDDGYAAGEKLDVSWDAGATVLLRE